MWSAYSGAIATVHLVSILRIPDMRLISFFILVQSVIHADVCIQSTTIAEHDTCIHIKYIRSKYFIHVYSYTCLIYISIYLSLHSDPSIKINIR